MKIAVLGAGMVGRTIALDLAKSYEVHSFDKSAVSLSILKEMNNQIHIHEKDLQQYEQYNTFLASFQYVITAVPGFMGYACLEAVIKAGKNVADISFFPEDALNLHSLAKEMNVTVITDVGVAPGMSNLILGRYNSLMQVHNFEFYVGGLPQSPHPPFFYKAPFSPIDVIEEYTRPARLREKGQLVTKEALSEREMMTFDGVGTMEAFNTDGLRSLLYTLPHIPEMKEKTLRYPGHIDLIIALRDSGFFETSPKKMGALSLSPIEFTANLLMDNWKLGAHEPELTVMKVIVEGEENGSPKKVVYDLLDFYDQTTGLSSMSRSTGYTCTAALQLIIKGLFTQKGVYPPEFVGSEEVCFDFIIQYLKERGVEWTKKES